MKKIRSFLGFTGLAFALFAQQPITVKEADLSMSKGLQHAFRTEIPQGSVKDVERDWKRYLNARGKARLSETNDEIAMRGIVIKEISNIPFNLYSILSTTPAGVQLTAWFTYNDTLFFSSHSGNNEAVVASRMLRDFAAGEYFLAVRNELKNEKAKLEQQEDNLERQIRLQEKSEMKVADNKRVIARTQDDLIDNAEEQKEISGEISRQQTEEAKARNLNGDAYNAADEALKSMEDDKKRLQSKNEELHKKIDEWNKEITEGERNVAVAKQMQTQLGSGIEKQKALIKDIATKLKGIM